MEYRFTGQCNNKRFVELQNMRKFILTRFLKDIKLPNEFQGDFLKFCSPEESTTPDDKDVSPSDWLTVYEFSNIAKNVPLKCLVSYKPTPIPSQRTKTLRYWLYFYLFDRVILSLTCYLFPSLSKTKCTYPPLLKSNTLFQNSSLPPNPSPLPLSLCIPRKLFYHKLTLIIVLIPPKRKEISQIYKSVNHLSW